MDQDKLDALKKELINEVTKANLEQCIDRLLSQLPKDTQKSTELNALIFRVASNKREFSSGKKSQEDFYIDNNKNATHLLNFIGALEVRHFSEFPKKKSSSQRKIFISALGLLLILLSFYFINRIFNFTNAPEVSITEIKGLKYKTITLKNGQTWLAKGLDTYYPNSWCLDEMDDNCRKFGRLYPFQTAKQACRNLGDGWRLPSDVDWKKMIGEFGSFLRKEQLSEEVHDSAAKAYKKMRAAGFNISASGGYRVAGEFNDKGSGYWSDDLLGQGTGEIITYSFYFGSAYQDTMLIRGYDPPSYGYYCLCVKN